MPPRGLFQHRQLNGSGNSSGGNLCMVWKLIGICNKALALLKGSDCHVRNWSRWAVNEVGGQEPQAEQVRRLWARGALEALLRLTSQVLPKRFLVDANHPLVCCTRKQGFWLLSCFPDCQTLAQSLHLLKYRISHGAHNAKNLPAGLCRGSAKRCVCGKVLCNLLNARDYSANSGHRPGHSLFPFPVAWPDLLS